MIRGSMSNFSQPTVKILLIGPHTYQISFRNIYGYLKTLLFDRCKKVGAQYLYYQNAYVITSERLADLKKEFQEVLNMKTNDNKMKFKIQDFPMTRIQMILKTDKKTEGKDRNKNRIIFIDKSSLNRYFYLKKRIEDIYRDRSKNGNKNQKKFTLIITSEINRKFWLSNILQPKKIFTSNQNPTKNLNPQFPQVIQLTYSELSSKKMSINQSARQSFQNSYCELNKIYLMTFDNLKFVENSWILSEVQMVSMLILDDAEFLVTCQNELSTLQNKKRNYQNFKLLLKNYPIDQQLLFFFSKLIDPVDLYNILVLTKPKNFSGIKFSTTLNSCIFNESLFTLQQKCMYDEFSSWFRKRYRNENKSFKEIFYLLKNVIVKTLDESVFKRMPDLLPSLELNPKLQNNIKITLIESTSEIVEKFRIMDRKYKKACSSISLKQILQDFHDTHKSSDRKFQIASKVDDHLFNRNSKNYFFQAKQLMLNSKLQMILKRLYFTINSQKERICIVIEDQKLQKRLKKYFKETQVQYIDYELPKGKHENSDNYLDIFQSQNKKVSYSQFDSNNVIKACIININRVHKQYLELKKRNKGFIKKDFQNQFGVQCGYSQNVGFQQVFIPRLTTPESIHFIDSFWNEFNYEKQRLLQQIFQFQLSYIEESQIDGKINFNEVYKPNKIIENYFTFDGSHEKVMLQKYLLRKQSIQSTKFQENQSENETLQQFFQNRLTEEMIKFSNCEAIDYLDIDEQFDKIQQEAKKIKNNKQIDPLQEKVFLPKFTKPDCKSFKQMLQYKLMQKNMNDILEESQIFEQYKIHLDQEKKQENKIIAKEVIEEKDQDKSILKLLNQQQKQKKIDHVKDLADQKSDVLNDNFELSSIFTQLPEQFLIQTPRLQQNTLVSKEPTKIVSQSLHNQPAKDLFDELLGPQYEFDYLKEQNEYNSNKKQQQLQEVQTESQLDEDRYLIQPKKWVINNKEQQKQKLQDKKKDELLLMNFGYMAYHNLNKQDIRTRSSCLPNNSQSNNLPSDNKNDDDSIEIIQTASSIKRKNHYKKLRNHPLTNRIRPSKYLSNRINKSKTQKLTYYQLPKQKRLCSKKLYEEAISKSKQLWEKKLRKQKELLILKSAKIEIDLKPKQGWKYNLTPQDIQKLKTKGIQL